MFRRALVKPTAAISRSYHAVFHPTSNSIIDSKAPEAIILTKALDNIPKHGFHMNSITQAVRDMKYSDSLVSAITSNPSGNTPEFQIMLHWLKSKRQELEQYILNPETSADFHNTKDEYQRVAHLIKKRLLYNSPIIKQLPQGLGNLVLPYNMAQGLTELYDLVDDITYYSGDLSNDFAWYSKRASFASVYVASELFMLQDTSEGFKQTKEFVDNKVANVKNLGSAYEDVEQWSIFNAISLVNLIKSQLARG